MTANKHSTAATWTDPDDAPELTANFFRTADVYEGAKLKTRGRPKAATTKEPVKLRFDADVLAALRASGEGWQTRINDTLRAALSLAGRVCPPLQRLTATPMRNLKHIQPLGVDCLDPWAEPPSTHQFDFHAFKARKRQAIQPQCRPSRSRQRQRPTWPRVATEAVISGGQTRPTSTPMRFGMCATHWRAKQNKAAL